MGDGAQIKKKHFNIVERFYFGFTSSNIIPTHDESILDHDKAILVGTIIQREHIHVGENIDDEIFMRARLDQTSLPFPVHMTQVCQSEEVPFRASTYVRIIPALSKCIRRIEAKCLRDDASWRKPLQQDSTPFVYPNTLVVEASTYVPLVEKVVFFTPFNVPF